MALVSYSDSESDGEGPSAVPAQKSTKSTPQIPAAAKPSFQRTSQPGKIRIDLPTLTDPAVVPADEGPSKKRAKTGGVFSGFNSLLPPPKRAPVNSAPSKGVSLKTSSEAAFSRGTPAAQAEDGDDDGTVPSVVPVEEMELKLTGKNTMFVPASVTNRAKAGLKPAQKAGSSHTHSKATAAATSAPAVPAGDIKTTSQAKPKPERKVKQSLFSYQQEPDEAPSTGGSSGDYEPLMTESTASQVQNQDIAAAPTATLQAQAEPSTANGTTTLQDLASDLNLTPAQRRQLFGRNANAANNLHQKAISVANFNLDSEYANNEALRQAGEVVSQRAVRAIAPGKHSLQQLVNNARSQRESIEESWAEGKRKRGAGFGGQGG